MSAASSGSAAPLANVFDRGVVLVVNIYLSKSDPSILLDDFEIGSMTQAYILLRNKQDLEVDASARDQQSNTLGVVMIPCKAKANRRLDVSQYPQHCPNNVVLHVVENVVIPSAFANITFK